MPIVVGLGRLELQKGFDVLIEAVACVRHDRRVRLLICGEGEERSRLGAAACAANLGDDFLMPGFVENPFALLARSQVFALSSRWEGLPNALIQAMVCGTPVVSTDCPTGPMEILDNGRWGRIVPVGDANALAHAIAASLDNPIAVDLSLALAPFAYDHIVDEYLALLGFTPYPKRGVAS